MSELSKSQKILMGIIYALTGCALVVIFFSLYNILALSKPQTLGTIYASTLSRAEDDVYIIEVNIYSNENKNGISCYEVLWNGYTDYQGNNIKGFGMQASVLPQEHKYSKVAPGSVFLIHDVDSPYITEFSEATMYYTDDLGVSSYVTNEMPGELYFDIDGSFYKYEFQTFDREVYSTTGWNFFNALFNITKNEKVPFNYNTLFEVIVSSALTDSARYENGEFTISMLDLSKYVKILVQNEDKQYVDLPKTSTTYDLFKVKVTYSKDGMTDASQSMFHQFKHSTTWNYYNNTDVEKYWNAYFELKLDEKTINYVFNEFESAYYIVLDTKFSQYLKSLSYAEISIVLDITAVDFDVYGIDLEHFDFKIKSFEILVDNAEDFEIYNSDRCSVNPTIKVV